MVGGRRLSCFLTCSSLLLLHRASSEEVKTIIHKKVGDAVELPSGLRAGEVSEAQWLYGKVLIADKDYNISGKQFEGRLHLDNKTWSLTISGLTGEDSGVFNLKWFNGKLQGSVFIRLEVHEPITQRPVLTYNSTWSASNESCSVFLECSATTGHNVSYTWTARNQTRRGPLLQDVLTLWDGDVEFSCTIHNVVSEMTASTTLKCNNGTRETISGPETLFMVFMAAGGLCLVVFIIVGVVACVCCRKRRPAGSDANDLTVYADISEAATERAVSASMEACSVYATVTGRVDPVKPAPQTVYDKIQFSRMRKTSLSPYQEVS